MYNYRKQYLYNYYHPKRFPYNQGMKTLRMTVLSQSYIILLLNKTFTIDETI